MPNPATNQLTSAEKFASSGYSDAEFIDLLKYPDLLILLQEIKNKFRLTPHDFHMVFAELKVNIVPLEITEFDDEIELLSMLFNLIFADQELPEDIKAQLARLQINMLISVIQQTGFVDRSANPIRRLLDTVVKTEIDLILSGKSNRSGIETLKQEIDKIVNCEVVDFSCYETLLARYQEQTGTAPEPETEQIPVDKTEEITKVTQIVLSMMQEFTVPLQVQNKPTILFDKVWTPLLLRVALTAGVSSSAWIKTVQTIKTQVWALTPKTTMHDYQKLTTILPHVAKSLSRNMSSLRLPSSLQISLTEYLELEQAEVLQVTETNLKSLKPKSRSEATDSQTGKKDKGDKFSSAKKSTSATKSPIKASTADKQVLDEVVDNPEIETPASIAGGLKNGDWIEIKQDDSNVMAKLTWRAEDLSLFIFVDRQGNRVREVDGATLDYEIATGSISVTNPDARSKLVSSLSFFNSV
jgi:hypothetical protein